MANVPMVTLTGAGAAGLAPDLVSADVRRNGQVPPARVRLGRIPAPVPDGAPRLTPYLAAEFLRALPDRIDWSEKAARSLARMYANDRYGNCVVAGKAHAVGVWTANDSDSGGEVEATDQEVIQQYQSICGPGDRGCVITRVLDHMRDRGLTFGGKSHKLDGYVVCDPSRVEVVKAGVALFGALSIGFNLPADWASKNVWDIPAGRIVGGHDVTVIGYEPRGVFVSSWGRVYLMTWNAFTSRAIVEECYALLAPGWYGADQVSPSKLAVGRLKKALEDIAAGRVPDTEPDPPAPPVVPPIPPAPPVPVSPPVFDVVGTVEAGGLLGRAGTFRGVATPRTMGDVPDDIEIEAADEMVAEAVENAVYPVMGMNSSRNGRRLRFRRKGLTPGQWAVLIQAVIAFVQAIMDALNRQAGDDLGDGERPAGAAGMV